MTCVFCEERSQPLKCSAIHCSGLPFFISFLFGASCVIESKSMWPLVGLSSHELSGPSRLPWHSLSWAASQPQAHACSSLQAGVASGVLVGACLPSAGAAASKGRCHHRVECLLSDSDCLPWAGRPKCCFFPDLPTRDSTYWFK